LTAVDEQIFRARTDRESGQLDFKLETYRDMDSSDEWYGVYSRLEEGNGNTDYPEDLDCVHVTKDFARTLHFHEEDFKSYLNNISYTHEETRENDGERRFIYTASSAEVVDFEPERMDVFGYPDAFSSELAIRPDGRIKRMWFDWTLDGVEYSGGAELEVGTVPAVEPPDWIEEASLAIEDPERCS